MSKGESSIAVKATDGSHHPIVGVTFKTMYLFLTSPPGTLWIIMFSMIIGVLSGMFAYTLLEIFKALMNAFPDFDMEFLDTFFDWWKSVKNQ